VEYYVMGENSQAADANPGPNAAPSHAAKPSPALNPDQEKALDALDRLADAIRDTMNAAANAIHAGKADEAVPKQSDAVEQLDGVFMAVAPFVDVVRKGIAAQEGLISLGEKRTISAKDAKDAKEKQDEEKRQMPANNSARAGRTDAESEQRTDWPEAAWNQRFITRYGQVLPMKAKRELEQLSAMPAVPTGTPSAAPGAVSAAQPDPRKAMEEALQAGIELAPKVAELSRAAADDLDAARPADALPRQQEALELLKKMLPKQEQQQNDRNQQDQNKNQQQNQKDQEKKDQEKKEQDKDKKEQEKQDQEKKEQEKKDKEKKDQEKQDQDEKSAAPKGEDFSKQQIEAALRRVRQRQQERKEQEKALLRELYRPDKVDKDW